MILTIAIIIYNIVVIYAMYKCYSKGIENGYNLANNKEVKVVKTKDKPVKIPVEEQKYLEELQKSWNNINNYNGTNIGQVDIN